MKKILIISLFVLAMIIPNINVKAVDVSNEEELRAAIEQGGNITLTQNIEIKEPLVIDKDVNISGRGIMMQGDNTLMTVNSGNVTLGVDLIAGWNGQYNEWGNPNNVIKNQGIALEINGGTVNFENTSVGAGKVGIEINGGTVIGSPYIYAGEYNESNNTYSGGKALVVNGGKVELNADYESGLELYSGRTAIVLSKSSNITLNGYFKINSYEENGIEVNDGVVVNINSIEQSSNIFGSQNAIYLNGGTANLGGIFGLSSSSAGYGIYINKGINTSTKGDVLNLKNDFRFIYSDTPNFSIYVNPDITELRVTDEKGFFDYINNKLSLGFCGAKMILSQTDEERKAICTNLNSNYDGPIESNELGKCMVVYINGEKQNEVDASCTPVAEDENSENNEQGPQIVEVPSTSAYGSIIIIVLGIICVIVSVFVMRKMTKKTN